ncbi:cystathionine gamma-synthase/methionine-gamma-lyase [Kribbella sp. VKM Ac-2527]|uniref:homocysteine desulfhydrase n=1 Tax=Kribbella caucasensis TaxID=2512215 RepID=A0A4R6KH78_9ACTN|nr:aminotransferase class I/II-fold pyridoxal phosphate-dependent enzyme [Kribbella sp. VKM Ac-2527]TDO48474.1 cystathionine gamma-synthase/methionine-gamma-lyase [Kribbella sp. VKM Ac-2527]
MIEGRPAQSERFSPRTRPVVPPIHQSVTYFLDDEAYKDVQDGGLDEIWYGRFRNPTVDVAADEVRRLEEAEAAFMTSSGMGAIATTLLTLLSAGDRVVAARQVYGDTRDLLVRDLPAWGFDVVQVDAMNLDEWRAAVADRPTSVVYVETLANPQLDLADLPAIARIAHDAGARLVVDNTFATPYCVQPLALGADVVLHSATKFLNGHSDAIAGVVAGSFDLVREVQRRVITLGTCLDPHAAYLVWRGLQTFQVRLAHSCATARTLATALAARDDVVRVRHPSLPDYERAEVAARVLRRDDDDLRAGGMVSFTVAGGDDRALRVMRRLQVACEATSLGGVETLVSTPFNSSHFSLTPEERRAARIDDGMIRVSCGVEPADVLIADFLRALDETP